MSERCGKFNRRGSYGCTRPKWHTGCCNGDGVCHGSLKDDDA